MPTGDPKEHEYFSNLGESSRDFNAITFLRSRGYVLTSRWTWIPPGDESIIKDDERRAIVYLINEWDFDGIESNTPQDQANGHG